MADTTNTTNTIETAATNAAPTTPAGVQGNYDTTINSATGPTEITGPGTNTLPLGALFNTATMQYGGKTEKMISSILEGKKFINNKINTRMIYGQRFKPQTIQDGTVIFQAIPLIPTSVYDPLDPFKVSQPSKINFTMVMSQMLQTIIEFDITTVAEDREWPAIISKVMGNGFIGRQDAANLYVINIIYNSLLGMGKFRFVDLIGNKGSRFGSTTPLWSTGAPLVINANGFTQNPDAYALQTEFGAVRNYASLMSQTIGGQPFNAGIDPGEIKWEVSSFLTKNLNYSATGYVSGDLYIDGKRKLTEYLGGFVNADINLYFQIPRPKIEIAPTIDGAVQPVTGYGFNNVQDYTAFGNLVGMTFIRDAVLYYNTPLMQLNVETGLAHSKRIGYVNTYGAAMVPTYYAYCMMFLDSLAYRTGTTNDYNQLLTDMTNAQNFMNFVQPGMATVTPWPKLPLSISTPIPGNKYGFNFAQLMQFKSVMGFAEPIPADTPGIPAAAQNVTLLNDWNPSYDELTLQPLGYGVTAAKIPLDYQTIISNNTPAQG